MPISRIVNNLHVARADATFIVDTTSAKDFTQTDLDNNLRAATISADNEVGMGSSGDPLVGSVEAVSVELSASIPVDCVVQIYGIAEFEGVATVPAAGDRVSVDGAGKVLQDTANDLAAIKSRGIVTNVHDTTKIEILL